MPPDEKFKVCFLCKCGSSLWEAVGYDISEAQRQLWSERHRGEGHGQCSYVEYMLARQGYMTSYGPFEDFYGKDWTKERNAP